MKNLGKIMLGLLGLVFLLLTISCEKESIDELYEQEKISNENLLVDDANFKEQNGDVGSPCGSLIDLALVIDESGSMDGARLSAAKSGAKLLIDKLNNSTLSALVSYNSGAERPFDLLAMDETGQNDLMLAIDQLNAFGGTNIQGGIIYAAEELTGDETLFDFVDTYPSNNDRDDAQKLMILLSDGLPNVFYNFSGELLGDPLGSVAAQVASDAADIAKAEGIRIITIAVTGADEALMKSLASSEDDFYTSGDEGLEALFEEISGTICNTRVVALDIHPTSCPNPLTLKAKGLLPVSINGSETLDVNEIDISTITLEGVSPLFSSIADVSTLFEVNLEEPLDPYSCTTAEADSYDDLTLKFDYDEIRSALGELERDDVLILEIRGQLFDGTEFIGKDIVIVK